VIGAFAGVAWVTGYTLLGLEVPDELRGRTFAFVQTMVRVVLVLVLAVSPLLAAALGRHNLEITDAMALTYNGAAFVFLLAGLLAAGLGVASYRHMDDRRGIPLTDDLVAAFHSEPVGLHGSGPRRGFFIALEGGEGAGKSTQARALAAWLESLGHDVLITFEPGATEVGRRLRSVLLDHPEPVPGYDVPPPPALSARTEALLFAADRAEHVATVVRPALALGHVVISDRYTDSSVAYQGAGRDLAGAEVGRLSRWATDGLQPHLTVLLDLPAADGLARVEAPDRLESEPLAFHERVRDRFLELARRGGARYLVVDGTQPAALVTAAILARLEPVLPPSAQQLREAELAREAEEQRQRVAEEARRLEQARARAEAEELARKEAAEAEVRLAQAAAEAAALAEQRRVQEEAAAAERARLAAISAAEAAKAREEHARLRALHAEERRLEKEEHRRAREAAHPHRAGHRSDVPADDDPATTRSLSLTDELFGIGDDGDDETSTIQLPRADHRRDER
jgi:dTMP kinase